MIPRHQATLPIKRGSGCGARRYLVFFNTTPAVCGPVIGVTAAMEEARANGAEIDDGTINGIKVGLMGPLAGVGDPLVWGTLHPITARARRISGTFGQHSRPAAVLLYFQRGASGDEVVWPTSSAFAKG
ncbi:PTS system mannose/fructose/sorbose family transporter subunit IID [Escherichia coli]